jgi:very-short-patch-repair endonuclease
MRRKFVTYSPKLKATARMLRKQSTRAEILLWNELKGKQMFGYDFHRQKPVHNYIVDFFCPRLMLAIEIDGSSHTDRTEDDKKRQTELVLLGIRFLRFQDDEVKKDLGAVVDIIRQWILEHHRVKI